MSEISRQARHKIENLFKEARLYISIGGAIVAVVFTIIQLKDIPFQNLINETKHEYVQAIALWIYYLCWVGGATFDAYYQKWVYLLSPTSIFCESFVRSPMLQETHTKKMSTTLDWKNWM